MNLEGKVLQDILQNHLLKKISHTHHCNCILECCHHNLHFRKYQVNTIHQRYETPLHLSLDMADPSLKHAISLHLKCPEAELQRRSSKILEERSTKRLLEVGYLYQSFTTLGLEPVAIVHYTRPGSSIKRPTPN